MYRRKRAFAKTLIIMGLAVMVSELVIDDIRHEMVKSIFFVNLGIIAFSVGLLMLKSKQPPLL